MKKTKLNAAIISLMILSTQALAEAWMSDKNGCKVLNPTPTSDDASITWNGKCHNGYINGPGVLEYFNKEKKLQSREDGTYIDGKLNGKAVLKSFDDNGFLIEGNFIDYKMIGKGKITSKDGSFLEGEFVNGDLTGKGSMSHNGVNYQGYFKNHIPDGEGVLTQPNGDRYEGNFVAGKKSGKGIEISPMNDARYEGDFMNGKFNGKGTLTIHGNRYEGNFIDGQLQTTP